MQRRQDRRLNYVTCVQPSPPRLFSDRVKAYPGLNVPGRFHAVPWRLYSTAFCPGTQSNFDNEALPVRYPGYPPLEQKDGRDTIRPYMGRQSSQLFYLVAATCRRSLKEPMHDSIFPMDFPRANSISAHAAISRVTWPRPTSLRGADSTSRRACYSKR
jgi:hypothetical protein